MRALFFHAGPGLNSNAEQHLLHGACAQRGIELVCWNEPSRRRPSGPPFQSERAFAHLLDESEAFFEHQRREGPVALVGHSFGAHVLRHLAARHPTHVTSLVYVCPALSLPDVNVNIFGIASRDYAAHGDQRWQQLEEVIRRSTGRFDENTIAGFQLAAANPRLFDAYWHDKARMAEFFRLNAAPELGLDVEAFFAVRASHFEVGVADSSVPAVAVFGAHDPVVSRQAELLVLRRGHARLAVEDFADAAHYAHLEEPERFVDLLAATLGGAGEQA